MDPIDLNTDDGYVGKGQWYYSKSLHLNQENISMREALNSSTSQSRTFHLFSQLIIVVLHSTNSPIYY
jgi:hypothetical protein